MGGLQRRCQGLPDPENVRNGKGKGPPAQPLGQRLSLVERHGQENAGIVGLAHLMDHAHVRVVEPRHRAGFGQEGGPGLGVGHQVPGKELEGHLPVQLRVQGTVDHAHPPLSENAQHLVTAEPRSREKVPAGEEEGAPCGRGRALRGARPRWPPRTRHGPGSPGGAHPGTPERGHPPAGEPLEEPVSGVVGAEEGEKFVAKGRVAGAGLLHERLPRLRGEGQRLVEEAVPAGGDVGVCVGVCVRGRGHGASPGTGCSSR